MSPRDQSKMHRLFFFFSSPFVFFILFSLDSVGGSTQGCSARSVIIPFPPKFSFLPSICLKFSCQILYENYIKKFILRTILRSNVMNLYINHYMKIFSIMSSYNFAKTIVIYKSFKKLCIKFVCILKVVLKIILQVAKKKLYVKIMYIIKRYYKKFIIKIL